MIQTAVDAPGEAPSMATMDPSDAVTSSVPKLQDAAVHWVLLDDLHALSGYLDLPILLVCIRVELAERSEALLGGLQNLAD